jgi:hypothetical protein
MFKKERNNSPFLSLLLPVLMLLLLTACGITEVDTEEIAVASVPDTTMTATAQATLPSPVTRTVVAMESSSTGAFTTTDQLNKTVVSAPVPTRTPYSTTSTTREGMGASSPTMASERAVTLTLDPTPTPRVVPAMIELSRSLYVLAAMQPSSAGRASGVWRLNSEGSEFERVTPPDLEITSFDVWPDDGRMVYGAETGQLFLVLPGQEPRLLYDAGLGADETIAITSVSWSPDGSRLAFTSKHPWSPDRTASQSDGLWLISLDDEMPLRLIGNRGAQWDGDVLDVSELRTIADPVWSPDGSALILTANYWEWADILLLEPVAADSADSNLRDPSNGWLNGTWADNGQSILLSGMPYSSFSDLSRVSRGSDEPDLLLEGEAEGLYIFHAQELPAGITFLAHTPDYPPETRLYLGHQTEDGFSYAPAGPDRSLCVPGYVQNLKWEPEGNLAILTCSQGIFLISLDGTVELDLSPYLSPLASQDVLKAYWGQP